MLSFYLPLYFALFSIHFLLLDLLSTFFFSSHFLLFSVPFFFGLFLFFKTKYDHTSSPTKYLRSMDMIRILPEDVRKDYVMAKLGKVLCTCSAQHTRHLLSDYLAHYHDPEHNHSCML